MRKIELRFDTAGILGGRQGCYVARFRDEPHRLEAGETPASAMGQLHNSYPEKFERPANPPKTGYPDFGALIPLVPEGQVSTTKLGKLILEFPAAYGVAISMIEAERWPKPKEPARNPLLGEL